MTIEEINNKKLPDCILTALYFEGHILYNGYKQPLIKCKCNCGNFKILRAYAVSRGRVKSCGCKRASGITIKPKGIDKRVKYRFENKRLYSIWNGIKDRCFNKNSDAFANYGGRNIKICNEWLDFQVFHDWAIINNYSDILSIDRIDNNGNYEPSNCRWATRKEQNNNTRQNRILIHNNISKTVSEWADYLKLPIYKMNYNLNRRKRTLADIILKYKLQQPS